MSDGDQQCGAAFPFTSGDTRYFCDKSPGHDGPHDLAGWLHWDVDRAGRTWWSRSGEPPANLTVSPITPTPPTPAERDYVDEAVALLTAAADKLERLVAGGTELPWSLGGGEDGWTIHGRDKSARWPVAGPYHEGGGVWEREDADLIVALVNVAPDLAVLLRAAVRYAAEGAGADPHLVAVARTIVGEGER